MEHLNLIDNYQRLLFQWDHRLIRHVQNQIVPRPPIQDLDELINFAVADNSLIHINNNF